MRQGLKKLAGKALTTDFYERFVGHAALQHQFSGIAECRRFASREELWDEAIRTVGADQAVTLLEFGVWHGYSLAYFAERFANPQSIFIGCDSFEGLPEKWGKAPAGTFDTSGVVPGFKDPRVALIKGWFQNTLEDAVALAARQRNASTLVHFDADLYSSTLFLLTRLSGVLNRYTAVFDEFTGHEARALLNYVQAYGADVGFLAATYHRGFPAQVLCKISCNSRAYRPTTD